jgi:HprK-related kinase A
MQDSHVVPFPRPVALKDQSIPILRKFAPDAVIGPAFTDTHKGTLAHMCPPVDSVKRSTEEAVPSWIVFPTYTADSTAELKPFGKARAFQRMVDYSFNYDLLGEVGFQVVAGVVDSGDCYEFTYDSLDEAITVLSRLRT